MPMQDEFYPRYGDTANNRSYFISDALIFMRSYSGTQINRAAEKLSNEDVAAFHRVIAALNATG